jgi:tRNA pseudouridine32 synthase/23S rRNA pseudouridine746 synthase
LLKSQNNPAITQFTSTGLSEGLRLCLCKPITGKTHQIRVAMKANGAAIVGDSYYAKSKVSEYDRLYLHAYRLGFTYNEQVFSFELLPDAGELFQGENFFQALAKLA